MIPTERELVRQTLTIIDGDAIRASNRVRDAIQIIRDATVTYAARKTALAKLEEANKILVTIPDAKKELYKLLDEQAHDSP